MGWTTTLDVVVSIYNEERDLPGCIRALSRYLAEQFLVDTTITVVDNWSTDDRLRVAGELASRTPGLRVWHLDANGRGLALRLLLLHVVAADARGQRPGHGQEHLVR
jgi:hypothetical protein